MKKYLFNSDLSDDQEHYAAYRLRGVFELVPMIKIEFRSAAEWKTEVPNRHCFWAFTSKNGVRAVLPEYFKLPETEGVFCVGPKTAEMLADRACEVSFPQVYSSEHLTEYIVQSGADQLIHFRGNLSGNELVEALKEKGVKAKGIEVYRTLKDSVSLNMDAYKGFVFMSPSAIEVFLEKNDPDRGLPVFCIGNKTAAAAADHGFKEVNIPEEATLESLVQRIKDYDQI
ncbi:uroporphyrinogen-III synthase [Balneola sp. MJW-20]|uniref:uroporphyrinogen-III synthase n=1 Tax=Gracilimonas aurantiaca TaxID=3234185 RepID=UPI00346755B5